MPEGWSYSWGVKSLAHRCAELTALCLNLKNGLPGWPNRPTTPVLARGYAPAAQPTTESAKKLRRTVFQSLGREDPPVGRAAANASDLGKWQDPSPGNAATAEESPSVDHDAETVPPSAPSAPPPSRTPYDELPPELRPPYQLPSDPSVPVGAGDFDYHVVINGSNLAAFKTGDIRKAKLRAKNQIAAGPDEWSLPKSIKVEGLAGTRVSVRLRRELYDQCTAHGGSKTMREKQKAAGNAGEKEDISSSQFRYGTLRLGWHRLRGFDSAGKTYIFFFDEFALTVGLLKQGVFRFGIAMNEGNALMGGGGLTALLGGEQQEKMLSSMEKMKLAEKRNRTGNLGVLGFFGSPGIDNNVNMLLSHDHMSDMAFLSYRTTDGSAFRNLEPQYAYDFLRFSNTDELLPVLQELLKHYNKTIWDFLVDQRYLGGIGTSIAATILVRACILFDHPAADVLSHGNLLADLCSAIVSIAADCRRPLHQQGITLSIRAGAPLAYDAETNRLHKASIDAVRSSTRVTAALFDKANKRGYFDPSAIVGPDGLAHRADGSPPHVLTEDEVRPLRTTTGYRVELAKTGSGGIFTPWLARHETSDLSKPLYFEPFLPIGLELKVGKTDLGDASFYANHDYNEHALVARDVLEADMKERAEWVDKHTAKYPAPVSLTDGYVPGRVLALEGAFVEEQNRLHKKLESRTTLAFRGKGLQQRPVLIPSPPASSASWDWLQDDGHPIMHHSLALTGSDDFRLPSGQVPPPFHVVPTTDFSYGHPLYAYTAPSALAPTTFAWDATSRACHAPFPGPHVYDGAFAKNAKKVFRDKLAITVADRFRRAREGEFSQTEQMAFRDATDRSTRLEMTVSSTEKTPRKLNAPTPRSEVPLQAITPSCSPSSTKHKKKHKKRQVDFEIEIILPAKRRRSLADGVDSGARKGLRL